MKTKKNSLNKLTKFLCISCDLEFAAYSDLQKELIKIDICGNCHPFYTGSSSMSVKTGRIEDFKQRERKSEEKRLKA